MRNYDLRLGSNLDVLPTLPDNSVDAIVTDPPYELGFMGKSWDSTGIAFNPDVWRECLRVLKPGGHLLAFSGSRTYHRMAVAIEDAGFQIRDQIMWIYGSGFPKSLDVSKAIDNQAGSKGADRVVRNQENSIYSSEVIVEFAGTPATPEAQQWQGWGTALKPAHEPIVLARKPLVGTVAANVLEWGTGGLNIDGSRVGSETIISRCGRSEAVTGDERTGAALGMYGSHPPLNIQHEGRFPANVIHDGSDEVVELFPDSKGGAYPAKRGQAVATSFASGQETEGGFRAMGDSGSAARFFYCAKASKRDRNEGLEGFEVKRPDTRSKSGMGTFDEKGVAAQSNHHPTVKPTDLMRYLCKLITPPSGTVLDPFMGSGSTGKGAIIEGFDFIGIELSEEYLAIAKARIEFAKGELQ